jgi:hypothetical protein
MTPHISTGKERRRNRRVGGDWPVSIALREGSYQARLRDVSSAGVCFFLDRKIPEMTVLELTLELPSADPEGSHVEVHGRGAVVRCEPVSPHLDHYEIAVFFNHLDERARGQLEAFVDSRE